jgi:rhodanese-related sulfurtransferase
LRGDPHLSRRAVAIRPMSKIDQLVRRARKRFARISADQAAREQTRGALIVDTRTSEQWSRDGTIPGAIQVDRVTLEWRLDPTSPHRIAEATHEQIRVIVVCDEGFSSSLAVASLHDLGLINATDVIGGFQAWKAAGLPVTGNLERTV